MSAKFTASPKPIPVLPLERCLGKLSEDGHTQLPALEHMLLVGHVAKRLLERMPECLRRILPEGIVTLAAAHDVGKISPGFQQTIWGEQLSSVCPELVNRCGFEKDHCKIGQATIEAAIGQQADLRKWAIVVGLHHGSLSSSLRNEAETYGGPDWAKLRLAVVQKLIDEFGPLPSAPPPESFTACTGLVCVADWIASDESLFPLNRPLEHHLSRLDHVLDDLGFVWTKPRPGLSFEDLFGFSANEIQDEAGKLADRPGLLLIEAPMGSGKTEAALWAAYRLVSVGHNHGIYFALPTRLSSNLIHKRVEDFLARAFGPDMAARLVHGHAWLYRHLDAMYAGGEELRPGHQWFAPTKRGILWPFGVGTVDQALLGVLCVKHFFLRLFGLAGKVVILDEIHSYDMYTGTLVDALVRILRELGATVILLTGTLTSARRKAFGIDIAMASGRTYPVIADGSGNLRCPQAPDFVRKKFHLRFVEDDINRILEKLESALIAQAAVVVICNTVRKAQEFYRQAKSMLPDQLAQIGLLHSLVVPWDRAKNENFWAQRLGKSSTSRGPSLLVATQVVEQSVDLDADLLLTELAPTDMLLQRMGRLWRHPRQDRPLPQAECWIIDRQIRAAQDTQDFLDRLGPTSRVYAPYVLWRTACALADKNTICFPEDAPALLEETYVDPQPDDPPWVADLFQALRKKQRELRDLAIGFQRKDLPALRDDEEVATRYSDIPTRPVLIVADVTPRSTAMEIRLVGRKDPLLWQPGKSNTRLAANLHLHLLNVPVHFLSDLPSEDCPDWVHFTVGRDVRVLVAQTDGRLRTLSGQPTNLFYSVELGFYREQPEGRSDDDQF